MTAPDLPARGVGGEAHDDPTLTNGDPLRVTPTQPLAVDVAAVSDRGQVRELNEDAVLIEPPRSPAARAHGTLLIVADGMGGHAAGEVASQLSVTTVHERYYASTQPDPGAALREAIEAANTEVWQQASPNSGQGGMGSTLTAAVLRNDELWVGHVGDSRAYLVRGEAIEQITTDHSWVAQQIAAGNLTPEQARDHPRRNVITRALGHKPTVEVDVYAAKVLPGDAVVLCSDGLPLVVDDAEIRQVSQDQAPKNAAEALVRLANERGAPDNLAVAVARITPPRTGLAAAFQAYRYHLLAAAVIVVVAVLALLVLPLLSPSPPERTASATAVPVPPAVVVPSPAASGSPIAGASPVAALPPPTLVSGIRRGGQTTEAARLRAEPSRNSASTGQLPAGTPLAVLEERTDGEAIDGNAAWYKVEVTAPDQAGQTGFVHSSLVKLEISGPAPGTTAPASARVGPAGANLRESAATTAVVKQQLTSDTRLRVIRSLTGATALGSNVWFEVEVEGTGQTGFVHSRTVIADAATPTATPAR